MAIGVLSLHSLGGVCSVLCHADPDASEMTSGVRDKEGRQRFFELGCFPASI